jgi:hypothetical protein
LDTKRRPSSRPQQIVELKINKQINENTSNKGTREEKRKDQSPTTMRSLKKRKHKT